LRIVHLATCDLCEIGATLAREARACGVSYQCFTFDITWIGERVDSFLDIGDSLQKKHLVDQLNLADVIILNVNHNYPGMADIDLSKKRLVMMHHGPPYRDQADAFGQMETAANYGRIVTTPDLLILNKPWFSPLYWMPVPVDIQDMRAIHPEWRSDKGRPLDIVHVYTQPENKGSGRFAAICKGLKAAGSNIELGLVHGVPRALSRWQISQADAVFVTYLLGPGMAAYEAMSLGVPCMIGCTEEELAKHIEVIGVANEDELPWVPVKPETTIAALDLLRDPSYRASVIDRAYRYVRDRHSPARVWADLRQYLDDLTPATGRILKGEVHPFA
jgi:hypothetical protein